MATMALTHPHFLRNIAGPDRTPNVRQCLNETIQLGVPRNYAQVHKLRLVHEDKKLRFIGWDIYQRPQWLMPQTARTWRKMHNAAKTDGIELQVVSAYRSIQYQLEILKRKLAKGISITEILKTSAAPGYSEHHSGKALDLTTPNCQPLEEEFESTPAFAWLSIHASRYGFRLSFPRNNPHGIAYEPWHWCYRGVDKRSKKKS